MEQSVSNAGGVDDDVLAVVQDEHGVPAGECGLELCLGVARCFFGAAQVLICGQL